MLIISRYSLKYDETRQAFRVVNLDLPVCPSCGGQLSGYDHRRRHAIDGIGRAQWYLCRRLRCRSCGSLHVELPDFMRPGRHYQADVIETALQVDHWGSCPADDSTIRRWKK